MWRCSARASSSRARQRRATLAIDRLAALAGGHRRFAGTPPLGDGDLLAHRQPGQLGADRVGGGVAQAVELVRRRGAGFHRPGAGDAQLAERLDRARSRPWA